MGTKSNKENSTHPTIKAFLELTTSLDTLAKQFLLDEGIQVGGEQFRSDWKALDNKGEHELVKALMFVKHMHPNKDFPQGMTSKDVDPYHLERYPFIAAVGIIKTAKQINMLSKALSEQRTVTFEQCNDYAVFYWRIKWLSDVLTMSEVYQANFSLHQKKIAGKQRPNALNRIITEILDQHPDFTWKQVLKELAKLKGGGVIEDITADSILWRKNSSATVKSPISGIKDRVSIIKKSRLNSQ